MCIVILFQTVCTYGELRQNIAVVNVDLFVPESFVAVYTVISMITTKCIDIENAKSV